MILTYMALYFKEMTMALSRSPKHVQDLNVNSTAQSISRLSLFFVYYTKSVFSFLFSAYGLVVSGIIVFIIGWILGIWAIATKTPLPYGSRISVGVGFAVGLLAIPVLWAKIWDTERVALNKVRKLGLIIFVILLGVIAACIWAVFHYATFLSYGERINIAVGMAVGVPCLYTLWVALVQDDDFVVPLVVTAVLCAVLAPSLWAIIMKTQLQQNTKVSLTSMLGPYLVY